MSLPYLSVNVACERSIAEYLTGSIGNVCSSSYSGGYNVYTGVNNSEKNPPAVIVSCDRGNEVFFGSNVYELYVNVKVKEIAVDTETMGELAPLVFNAFLDPDNKTNFSSTKYNFSVFQVQTLDISEDIREDTLTNEMSFKLIGCMTQTI